MVVIMVAVVVMQMLVMQVVVEVADGAVCRC